MSLSAAEFEKILGAEGSLPPRCLAEIESRNFEFEPLGAAERDDTILRILRALASDLDAVGRHRLRKWEDGWTENLQEFIQTGYDTRTLVPKFVKPNEVARLGDQWVRPAAADFETSLVTVLRGYLFATYFSNLSSVYEFGCGTSHNLVNLAELYPSLRLFGYDWSEASAKIVTLLREKKRLNIRGGRFDLFVPDRSLQIEPGAGVLTIGTLEQTGRDFGPFLEWLLEQPFSVCLNVETMYELYDQSLLFDYLAARYLEKRNYLRGYLPALRALEEKGRIRILRAKRTFGSLFHDGYSYVAWAKT